MLLQRDVNAVAELEGIKARGRAEWLMMHRQAGAKSQGPGPTRSRDAAKRNESEHDSSTSVDDDESK